MTEKEIIEHCYNEQGGFDRMLRIVLDLAKEHGAKFDPEPVKLPKLRLTHASRAVDLLTEDGCDLKLEEAAEVVRRCNLWPALYRFADEHLGASLAGNLLREALDGKISPHS